MGNRNSGARPKPTQLHVLRGNPSKKNLNVNEPVPPHGSVEKPIGLSIGAGAVWDELAPICLAMGTLTVADVRPFTSLCELQSTMQKTSAQKDEAQLFELRQDDPNDHSENPPMVVYIDSLLRLERETATALRPYYELFGLTPVARARISVPKQKALESKWAGVQ